MGCTNSKSTTTSETMMSSKTVETPQQQQSGPDYPQSEAFSIPFDNVNATDAAKKPPKRIQELLMTAEEMPQLTLAELQEKQERADQRRQELLLEKVATIQRNTQMLMHSEHVASTSTNYDDDDNNSTSRPETQQHKNEDGTQ